MADFRDSRAMVSQFTVVIDGQELDHIMSVGGLSLELGMSEEASNADTMNGFKQKMIGGLGDYGDITLTRYLTNNSDWFSWVDLKSPRTTASITVHTGPANERATVATFTFDNFYPISWSISDMDASGTDTMTEEIVCTYDLVTMEV